LFRHLRRLNLIRRSVPALQKAPLSHVNEWGSGLSFVRDHPQSGSLAAVGLAIGSDQEVRIQGVRPGLYRDAVTGREIRSQGDLAFHVKANSAGIYVLDGPGKIGEDGPYLR
jgi:hypothetical protein